jgi:hypothetical protein
MRVEIGWWFHDIVDIYHHPELFFRNASDGRRFEKVIKK